MDVYCAWDNQIKVQGSSVIWIHHAKAGVLFKRVVRLDLSGYRTSYDVDLTFYDDVI